MAVKNINKIFLFIFGIMISLIIFLLLLIKILNIDVTVYSIKYDLKYEKVEINNENNRYTKPHFNNYKLNKIIESYLNDNKCQDLDYSIFDINSTLVNLYLNCGKPKNVVYNYRNEKIGDLSLIIKNKDKFNESVNRLLKMKYPKFLVDEIDILNGTFDIQRNEIIAYYNTKNYGSVSIKINNNEIKDLMKYEMYYDKTYENEKFVLDKNKKTIAFTFDDGPSEYDLEIIDYMVENHASATFFMVGNRINNYQNSVFKMIETGMEVGNHSYSHKTMTKLSNSEILREINRTNEVFKNLTGKELKLFRAPYGSINRRVLLNAKMPSFLWSIDTLDWQSRNANKVYDSIINKVNDGDIVLMHSLYPSTVEAVKLVIPELYKQGIQVVSIGKLFELKDKEMEIGASYRKLS